MINKKILVSVSNDISNDMRVHKQCVTLCNMGFDVEVIGRKRKDSVTINRPYKVHRFSLLFNTGALFYAELNIRLFFYFLFKRCDVLLANDLDTLLANFCVSKIKSVSIVYDSHEYFTEVPELQGRAFAQNVWRKIEKLCVPHVKYMYTVNRSIAKLYEEAYKIPVQVIRNVPPEKQFQVSDIIKERLKLGLPADKKLLIIQGTGINIDRGVEEVVEAMQNVQHAELIIIGSGDVLPKLKQMVKTLQLEEKVKFIDKVPFEILETYTAVCDIGLTVDKASNLNYLYSLPNKLFNYIQVGIAVLSSDLVEVASIVNDYKIGEVIKSHQPDEIAIKLNEMIDNEDKLSQFKANSKQAAKKLNWENEEATLINIFSEFK